MMVTSCTIAVLVLNFIFKDSIQPSVDTPEAGGETRIMIISCDGSVVVVSEYSCVYVPYFIGGKINCMLEIK